MRDIFERNPVETAAFALAVLFCLAVGAWLLAYRRAFNRKDPFGFDGERDDDDAGS